MPRHTYTVYCMLTGWLAHDTQHKMSNTNTRDHGKSKYSCDRRTVTAPTATTRLFQAMPEARCEMSSTTPDAPTRCSRSCSSRSRPVARGASRRGRAEGAHVVWY